MQTRLFSVLPELVPATAAFCKTNLCPIKCRHLVGYRDLEAVSVVVVEPRKATLLAFLVHPPFSMMTLGWPAQQGAEAAASKCLML
jgi:hypothetical protein